MTNFPEDYKRDLPRVLSRFDATTIVVGAVIGSGIFLAPSIIAGEVRSLLGIIIVWAAAGVISFFGSMTYAELGSSFPKAGGQYVFLKNAYNPLIGFMYGWTYLVVLAPGSFATLSVAFKDTLATIVDIPPLLDKTIPVFLIIFILAINYRATKWGAEGQNVFTFLKIGALLCVIGSLFIGSAGNLGNITLRMPADISAAAFVHSIALAMIPAFWAYNGWHRLCFSAGEIVDAPRVIPKSLFAGILILIAVYVSANLAYVSALGIDGVAGSANVAADTVGISMGRAGHLFISIAILISITGVMSTIILTEPRILFAMARDGLFFPVVGWTHPRFHTPAVAIVVPSVIGIFFSLIGNFRELLTFSTLFNWSFYGLTVIGVFLLRRKFPRLERPYKTWGYPVVPLLFAGAVALVVGSELAHVGDRTLLALFGCMLFLLGFPAYYYWTRYSGKPEGVGK